MTNAEQRVNAMRRYNLLRNDVEARYNRGKISYEDMQKLMARWTAEFTESMDKYAD